MFITPQWLIVLYLPSLVNYLVHLLQELLDGILILYNVRLFIWQMSNKFHVCLLNVLERVVLYILMDYCEGGNFLIIFMFLMWESNK